MSTGIDVDTKELCETVQPIENAPETAGDAESAPTVETYLQQLPIRYPWHDAPAHTTGPRLLTKPTAKRICEALSMGHTHKTAAQLAGISPQTLAQWLSKGDTEEQTDQTQPYIALRCAVLLAEAEAEDTSIRSVRAAGDTDWKAHAWWLSRRHSHTWAERSREGESGTHGVTINVGIALPAQAGSTMQAIETTVVSVPELPE